MPMLQFTEKNLKKKKKTFSSTRLKHFPFFGKAAVEKENTVLPAPVSGLLDSGQAVRRDIKKAPDRGGKSNKAAALWELPLQGNKIMPCPRAGFNVLDCLWTIEIGTENPLFVSRQRKEVFEGEDKQTRAHTVKGKQSNRLSCVVPVTPDWMFASSYEEPFVPSALFFMYFCTFIFFTAPVFCATFCLRCATRLKRPCPPAPQLPVTLCL